MVKVIFVQPSSGHEQIFEAKPGQSLLDVAQEHGIDMEGACEGSMACSTCHVIVDDAYFKALPKASEEEEDMLDMTFGLQRTSRLACQIILDDTLDGLRVILPENTRNMLY